MIEKWVILWLRNCTIKNKNEKISPFLNVLTQNAGDLLVIFNPKKYHATLIIGKCHKLACKILKAFNKTQPPAPLYSHKKINDKRGFKAVSLHS